MKVYVLGLGDGYYLEFNGSTTLINCGADASLANLHDGVMTVEAWVQVDSYGEGSRGRIISKGEKWYMLVSSADGFGAVIDCATTDAQSFVSLQQFIAGGGRKHHLAFTWDDATMTYPRLWIDGHEAVDYFTTATRNGAVVSDASDDLLIGNRAADDRAFDGQIGWLRVSNEIRYTANFTPDPHDQPPETDATTVLLLKMDEGSGVIVADSSGNDNSGVITDGTWQPSTAHAGIFPHPSGDDMATATVSSEASTAARVPHQRCCFYAEGRYWCAFAMYDSIIWKSIYLTSSVDGITWLTPVEIGVMPKYDTHWGLEYDHVRNKMHLAMNPTTELATILLLHQALSWRLGTPNADGTLTWDGDWQEVVAPGNFVGDWSMAIDSDGHVWFAWGDNGSADPAAGDVIVTRNDNTNAAWSEAAGFPQLVHAGVLDDGFGILAPLDDGTMYCAVYEWNKDIAAEGYIVAADSTVTPDGTITTGNVEATSGAAAKVGRIEVAAIYDGEIHLVYQDTSQNIKYRKRSAAGVWASEVTLSNNTRVTDVISSPRLSFGESGEIYVTWSTATTLWLCIYDGASWGTPSAARTDSYEAGYEHAMPAVFAHDGKLQCVTLTSTYTLKHYLLDV